MNNNSSNKKKNWNSNNSNQLLEMVLVNNKSRKELKRLKYQTKNYLKQPLNLITADKLISKTAANLLIIGAIPLRFFPQTRVKQLIFLNRSMYKTVQ